jgi:hypothetical protein
MSKKVNQMKFPIHGKTSAADLGRQRMSQMASLLDLRDPSLILTSLVCAAGFTA